MAEEEEGRPEAETFAEANSVAALLSVTNCMVWYCSSADTGRCSHLSEATQYFVLLAV